MELLVGKVCRESAPNMLSDGSLPTNSSDSSMSLNTSIETRKDDNVIEHIGKKPRLSFGDDFEALTPRLSTPSGDADDEMPDTKDPNDEVDTTYSGRSSVHQDPLPSSSTSNDGVSTDDLHQVTAGSPSQQKSLKKRKLDESNASESLPDYNARRTESDKQNSDDHEFSEGGYEVSGGDKTTQNAADGEGSNPARTSRKKSFRKKRFDTLASQLRTIHEHLPASSKDLASDIVEIMQEKFKQERPKSKDNNVPHPRTAEEIIRRLKGKEEDEHPWAPTPETATKVPKYAFRAFTEGSQSKINDDRVGFQSRKSYGFLDTAEQRKTDIQNHTNWRNRRLTPFISTSCSWAHIFKIFIPTFKKRYEKKGNPDNTKLALINFSARLAANKPVISMTLESHHYKIPLGSGKVCDDEYLCPYEIGPDEIVCTWRLDWVENWMNAWIDAKVHGRRPTTVKKKGRRSRIAQAEFNKQQHDKSHYEELAANAFQEEVAKPAYEKHEKERLEALARP
jgi:hypothetical protein